MQLKCQRLRMCHQFKMTEWSKLAHRLPWVSEWVSAHFCLLLQSSIGCSHHPKKKKRKAYRTESGTECHIYLSRQSALEADACRISLTGNASPNSGFLLVNERKWLSFTGLQSYKHRMLSRQCLSGFYSSMGKYCPINRCYSNWYLTRFVLRYTVQLTVSSGFHWIPWNKWEIGSRRNWIVSRFYSGHKSDRT